MVESIGLCCTRCNKVSNVDFNDAKNFNKENPFICQTCLELKPKEEPINSRLQESERFSNPDLINEVQETKTDDPSPAHPKKDVITIKIPKLETLEDFEHAAVGEIKEKLDEFRHRREQAEKDLAQEQTRVDRYERGFRHHHILGIVGGLVMTAIMIAIFTQVIGNVTSQPIDCSKLPGGAGIHETTANASGWALNCMNQNQMESNSMTLLMVIVIIVVPITILFVVRIL